MMNAADLSIVIASAFNEAPSVDGVPTMVSARPGPQGWSDVMSRLAGIYETRNADG
jgi:hypothetical protein